MRTQTIVVEERDGIDSSAGYIVKSKISELEKELLRRYLNSMIAGECGKIKSHLTIRGAIFTVKAFAEFINKPLRNAQKQDIIDWTVSLRMKGRSPVTIGWYAIRIRQFYLWLDGEMTDKIRWIKKVKTKKDIQESDLITPSEVKKLVSISDNIRDKALICGLYESACRISEWLHIKIKDIIFDDYGAKVKVSGKTGARTIRLIDSVLYLTQWINSHPYKDNKESYVFFNFSTNHYGTRLLMGSVGIKLRTYAKRAKLNKYIHPHLLRHSRLTWLAQKEGFNERDLRIFAGWSSTSDMPDTYLHYGEEEVDKKLRRIKGLNTDKETETEIIERKVLESKICPRCKTKNPSTASYCNCGMGLDIKVLQDEIDKRNTGDEILNKIVNDPELSKVFVTLINKVKEKS